MMDMAFAATFLIATVLFYRMFIGQNRRLPERLRISSPLNVDRNNAFLIFATVPVFFIAMFFPRIFPVPDSPLGFAVQGVYAFHLALLINLGIRMAECFQKCRHGKRCLRSGA